MSDLFIGTSGWSYDEWVGDFYPDRTSKSDMLEEYVTHFNSVEINATFYRLPFENMVKGWHNKAPENFTYAVKGSRQITHYDKLDTDHKQIDRLHDRMKQLGDHLGPFLWQLPPSLERDDGLLDSFLQMLPEDRRHAFEFRHPSWFEEDIYKILEDHGAAPVWISSDDLPDQKEVTTDFVYGRLHGLTSGYSYTYDREELKPWADSVREILESGKDAYLYFNNTGGNAPRCAEWMQEMTGVEV
ncbi:MAG: DUF72 domain-containing protein [Balneolaceae bacterium]|nr:DUF72 domain-containing protein [Balneolaceae bacterium]